MVTYSSPLTPARLLSTGHPAYADSHSHVHRYTEMWRILLMASWLLASTHTLAYSLTHSTHSSILNATTLGTTSYPCALTMVVLSCVPMCPGVRGYVYLSVGLCVAVPASAIGCSRLQYFLLLHPE